MREARPRTPVVRWHPWKAERHAIPWEVKRSAATEAAALCGCHVELREPEAADWFFPTCAPCMDIATRPASARSGGAARG